MYLAACIFLSIEENISLRALVVFLQKIVMTDDFAMIFLEAISLVMAKNSQDKGILKMKDTGDSDSQNFTFKTGRNSQVEHCFSSLKVGEGHPGGNALKNSATAVAAASIAAQGVFRKPTWLYMRRKDELHLKTNFQPSQPCLGAGTTYNRMSRDFVHLKTL